MTLQSEGKPADDAASGPVKLGWLGGTIGYNLRLAQNASFHAFSELTGDTGLRPGRYALLQLIDDNPGVSQTVLSRAVGRDKSTLTPVLGDLERRSLIIREPDPLDRRGLRMSLTAAGKSSSPRSPNARREMKPDSTPSSGQKKGSSSLNSWGWSLKP